MPPKRIVHRWSTQERHFVFVLFNEYDQTNDEIAELFNYHYYNATFALRPNGMRIRDEYASRYGDGRTQMWANHIERQTYTIQQETERRQARQLIQRAAQALGIILMPLANGQGAAGVATTTAPTAVTAAPSINGNAPMLATDDQTSTKQDASDASSVLSSPPASPPPPPQHSKRAHDDADERVADERVANEESDSEDNIVVTHRSTHATRPGRVVTLSRVQTPAQQSQLEEDEEYQPDQAAAHPTKRQRIFGPRDVDADRNARAGFPGNYSFLARHEFEVNSRILPMLDARYEASRTLDLERAQGRVHAMQARLLHSKAVQAAQRVLTRTYAAQVANGTITAGQPAQIFAQQLRPAQQAQVQGTDGQNDEADFVREDGAEDGGGDGGDGGEEPRGGYEGRVARRIARVIAREMTTRKE